MICLCGTIHDPPKTRFAKHNSLYINVLLLIEIIQIDEVDVSIESTDNQNQAIVSRTFKPSSIGILKRGMFALGHKRTLRELGSIKRT